MFLLNHIHGPIKVKYVSSQPYTWTHQGEMFLLKHIHAPIKVKYVFTQSYSHPALYLENIGPGRRKTLRIINEVTFQPTSPPI